MKKLLILLTGSMISATAIAQNTTVEYYASGKKRAEGVAIGDTKAPSGETKDQAMRRTSTIIKDGKWTYWYEDGKVNSEESYVKGTRSGVWKSWYQNGNLQSEINFSTGQAKYWYEDGKIFSEGKMDANMTTYGKWVGYYANGNKNYEGSYDSNGMKTGTWTWYKESGEVMGVQQYEAGKLIDTK